ncbi:MAG: long-chain fatty acid--CoA ligase [Pseudomonadales bacterium]|nr:long-chain fatty acid--CoA ligase [Pseudomonadales bacterium]MEC8809876.1 AMP-binding protein [Pseudomonadota bacterium]HAG95042.1 long-chain fatty acid--CoA ligase [Gammaproteobacteria bacterium]MAQ25721.1 long-chain fatty acid--CoA ligase [Pseudomonadales bacterium]HBO93459.1 long-chain fatty acid--CoA ligase [Gammaproteobacteria bacterium]|tara:strand:+ start:1348 stop:3012 length:1665 start_codon:yes stop_codon:yes gene_type:complete
MVEKIWSDKYPEGVTSDIQYGDYESVLDVFENACKKFADRPAFHNMGVSITYGELDKLSADFAAYLQHHTTLVKGDRIAVQMPNLIQYPIVIFGALRAGMVVVNTNPMYTTREMEHQFNDAGCKALVALANFGDSVADVLPKTGIKHVIITQVADMQPPLKRVLMNFVIKHIKKMVPDFTIKGAVPFTKAMAKGAAATFSQTAQPAGEDIAVLQYTGGTTGVAKGAMLTHKNLVSNMLQMDFILRTLRPGQEVAITPLPLYHIFSFTVNCLGMMSHGAMNVLITNPRDIPAFVKELGNHRFSCFTGLNTLFVALMNHPEFKTLDFSSLKMTIAGGMALQKSVADQWESVTGNRIAEGFGMTETSPVVCVNPPHAIQVGTIGIPVPGTDVKIVDEDENELAIGESGELCVRGPQVMKGYWQREEATRETMTKDGEWLKTGDVALIQEDGFLRIVDRKKDMILVSGFNVYPNEVEDVACTHPGIVECAAVGVPDDKSGEAVKLFVVKSDDSLTAEQVIAHCKENLTGYKVPRLVEFRADLPKTNVGKILRRELRGQ